MVAKYFGQQEISEQRRMPVDDMTTATATNVSETVTDSGAANTIPFQYYNGSGVLTTDAGQAAGTPVLLNLSNKNILNDSGDVVGNFGNSSFAFGTGTIFPAAQKKPFRGIKAEDAERNGMQNPLAGQARLLAITNGFTNGDWCLDDEHGIVYGVKKTTGKTETVTYKVLVAAGSGSFTPSTGNITQVGGVAVPTAGADGVSNTRSDVPTSARISGFNGTTWDRIRTAVVTVSATLTGFLNTLPWAVFNTTPTTRTNGQGGPLEATAQGDLAVAGNLADGQTNNRNPILMGGEAQDPTSLPTATTAGKIVRFLTDLSRRIIITLGTTIAGEDLTKDVMKVEQRFTRSRATADTLIATGAGFLHTLTLSPLVAVPTAGLATVYDNTAESGTILYAEWMFATTPGHSISLDVTFGTGLYVGFDGTLANVAVGCSYRQ